MSSNSWKGVGLAYVALYLMGVGIESHGFHPGPLSPMDKIFFAPILWGVAAYGIQTGAFRTAFSWVDRDERPFSFWTTITLEILYGFFLLGWGMRDAFR
jgi:hypothetical protein